MSIEQISSDMAVNKTEPNKKLESTPKALAPKTDSIIIENLSLAARIKKAVEVETTENPKIAKLKQQIANNTYKIPDYKALAKKLTEISHVFLS